MGGRRWWCLGRERESAGWGLGWGWWVFGGGGLCRVGGLGGGAGWFAEWVGVEVLVIASFVEEDAGRLL